MMSNKKDKIRILVLDGDHKNALAIIRHLGKNNREDYLIDVVSYSRASICFYSKYTDRKFIVTAPKVSNEKFLKELLDLLKKEKFDVMLPVSHIAFQICSANKDEINKYTRLTITNKENIELAFSKVATYDLAEKLSVPYPKIYRHSNLDELVNAEITFPCVIKAPFEAGINIVEYADNKNELISKYKVVCNKLNSPDKLPVVQKFIRGQGFGFFAFYKDGNCKRSFMHRRIREYPVTGGASTCAESFRDEKLFEYGKKILDYLKWDGVAMVEFKTDDSTGEYNLMEINAKFWGSLDLALQSGVNFPQMLIDNAQGKDIPYSDKFNDVRFQWILNGEVYHALEKPSDIFGIISDLFKSKNDIYITDIKPNLFQLAYIPLHYYKKWFKKK